MPDLKERCSLCGALPGDAHDKDSHAAVERAYGPGNVPRRPLPPEPDPALEPPEPAEPTSFDTALRQVSELVSAAPADKAQRLSIAMAVAQTNALLAVAEEIVALRRALTRG